MSAAAAWVPGLGPLESAIMTAIWDAGQPLSVRVVRERMDYQAADGEDPAYTTVMSVMVILWRKGFLDRAKYPGTGHRRAWWYAACISREDHLATVIRQALDAEHAVIALVWRDWACFGRGWRAGASP